MILSNEVKFKDYRSESLNLDWLKWLDFFSPQELRVLHLANMAKTKQKQNQKTPQQKRYQNVTEI